MSKRKGRPVLVLALTAIVIALNIPSLLVFARLFGFESSFLPVLFRTRIFLWNWIVTFLCVAYVLVEVLALGSYPKLFRRVIMIVMIIASGLAGYNMFLLFIGFILISTPW